MPNIGLPELLIIGILLLLVFGGSRLPALGESAGRAVGKLLRATKSDEPQAHGNKATPDKNPRDDDPNGSVSDAELVDAPSNHDQGTHRG